MAQKILLVDDCLVTQALIRETLGPKYSVTGVTSPSAAYEQLGQNSFDLVLLHVDLPEQDGFEFCEKIKSDNSGVNLPVFFLSGRNTLDDKLMGFRLELTITSQNRLALPNSKRAWMQKCVASRRLKAKS